MKLTRGGKLTAGIQIEFIADHRPLFTSAALIVRSVHGVDLAPILHKLPRGYPSCQLWLLCFVCLVLSSMPLLYVWHYNRYVILLPTQIITGFIRFFFYTKEEDYTTTEFYNIYTKYTAFQLNASNST